MTGVQTCALPIFKGTAPDVPLAIIFQPTGDAPWWSDLGEELETGAPRVVAKNHPALRHLEPEAITFVGARQLTPCEGAQILVADENNLPLVYKATRGAKTAIVVNIDPLAADFYFSAWFPVLVHSSATHLVGRELPSAATHRPGDAVPIPAAREDTVTKWKFLNADGEAASSGPSPADRGGGRLSTEVRGKWWTGGRQLGFYELENESGSWPVGISLLAADETLLNPDKNESAAEPISRGRAPAYWLTALAIIALATESILYHRRKVG